MSEIEFHSAKRRVQDKARELSIEKSGSHTRVPLSAPKHPGVLNQKTPKHTGVAASATLTLNGGSATDSFQLLSKQLYGGSRSTKNSVREPAP